MSDSQVKTYWVEQISVCGIHCLGVIHNEIEVIASSEAEAVEIVKAQESKNPMGKRTIVAVTDAEEMQDGFWEQIPADAEICRYESNDEYADIDVFSTAYECGEIKTREEED